MGSEVDRVELQLHKIGANGQNRSLISPMMIPPGPNRDRLFEIRAYIEEMELLEFKFDFWNVQLCCRIDRRFEKANFVRGQDVIVVESEVESAHKKRRVEAAEFVPNLGHDDESLDMFTGPDFINGESFQPPESDFSQPLSQPSESTHLSSPPIVTDRTVAPEDGGPPRLRSLLIQEDIKEAWLRGVRSCKTKMERSGFSEHMWWLETWDERGFPVAKIWCQECHKWLGNGKVEGHSNALQNFFRQHLSSGSHLSGHRARVGKEAAQLEKEAQKILQDRIDHKQKILEGVEIVKKVNEKAGDREEIFVIEGDLSNEKLSSTFFKWKCIYCRQLNSLCPRSNNLQSTLDAHVSGDRHLRKKQQHIDSLADTAPLVSGRVGRPSWRAVACDEKQQLLKVFYTSRSGSSVGSNIASSSKGIFDGSVVCWGLWRHKVRVNGELFDVRPFLLDQQRGNVWYSEPFTAAELYFSTRSFLVDGVFRHDACIRINVYGVMFRDFTCDFCRVIPQEKDFRSRVYREQIAVERRGDRDTGNGRRIDYLRQDEAVFSFRKSSLKMHRLERDVWLLRARLAKKAALRKTFLGVQTELANRKDVTTFCKHIIDSWRDGLWGGKAALWDFMTDVARNLHKKKGGQRYSPNTKVMFEVVKLRAGPQVSNFLGKNLMGPSLVTTRRDCKKNFQYVSGESEAQFKHIGETYARLKAKLGIVGPVPFIFAEDETSVRKMVRWDQGSDRLTGFCGVKDDHKCVHNFYVVVGEGEMGYTTIVDSFKDCTKANYARILMANPLHGSLPALLIVAMSTCNTFDAKDIRDQWNRVDKLWRRFCLDLAGPILGHASDGDSRRRCVQLEDYCSRAKEPQREFRIDWHGFTLGCFKDGAGNVFGLHDQDWVHNVKKLISPLDSACRTLWLGAFIVRLEHIVKVSNTLPFDEHGLNQTDVNRDDRQNFKSAQTLCSRKVVAALAKMRVRHDLTTPERTQGTEAYLEIVGDYMDIWASPVLTLRERIVKAGKVLYFFKLWKLFIAHGEHGIGIPSLGENFVSNQCFLDVTMSCHFAVLLVKTFRDHFSSFPVPFSRTGSDVCEIFFSKVGGMSGVERAYDFGDLLRSASSLNRLAEIESGKGGVVFPRAHGKMKCVWEDLHPVPVDANGRRTIPDPDLADYSQVATDAQIVAALQDGLKEAGSILRILDMAPSTHCAADKSKWFRKPWEFEEPLTKKLRDLVKSVAEEGDDGDEINLDTEEGSSTGPGSVAELDVDTQSEEEIARALEHNSSMEEQLAVAEVQHIIFEEMPTEETRDMNVNEALGKKVNPKVPLPGKDGDFIWKARLVSQLNGNPFLSKDRLQRVKGAGNQYYSREELDRLKSDPSIINLTTGHDVAVLFEAAEGPAQHVSNSVRSRKKGSPADVTQQTRSKAYFELGRIQVLKKKRGGKWVRQKEIIDLENIGAAEVQAYLYWYTPVDGSKSSKWKYDGVDKCWVDISTVIQLVNLAYNPSTKTYTLEAPDVSNLQTYVSAHNRAADGKKKK